MIRRLASRARQSAIKRMKPAAEAVRFVWSRLRREVFGIRSQEAEKDRRR